MSLPISVCLIVRNEERALPGCLDSIAPFVAEVIVVDTGSTDRTRAIASGYEARIADFAWCDDFGAARNFAASLASQPHIFVLDADERLVAATLSSLEAYCRAARPVVGRVVRTNLADDNSTALTLESLSRLYPNLPGYRYHGRVHEQILCDGLPAHTVETGIELIHTGYSASTLADGHKVERNLRLLQLAHDADPTNAYVAYQIGRSEQAAGRLPQATTAYRAALARLDGRPPAESPYLSALLVQLGYALLDQHDLSALFDVLGLATELYPDFTDLYFLYGLALLQLDDPSRLADVGLTFEHCLTLGEPNPVHYESVPGVGSYRAAYNLGVFHESLGNNQLAMSCFERAAASNYMPAIERIRTGRRSSAASGTQATPALRVAHPYFPNSGAHPSTSSADH